MFDSSDVLYVKEPKLSVIHRYSHFTHLPKENGKKKHSTHELESLGEQ